MIALFAGRALVAALAGSFRCWRRRRATIRALMSLNDGTLKDIGLSRSDIPRRAREVAEEARTQPRK